MLSEISQTDKYCMFSLTCGTEKIKQRTITKQKQPCRHREQTDLPAGEREAGQEGRGFRRHKLLCIQQATSVHYTAPATQPVFQNNFKWSIIYKNFYHRFVHWRLIL